MKKKLSLAIIGLLVGILALVFVLDYTFNPKPRVIAEERAAFFIPADELQYFFATNEVSASNKYMDKVIEVEGVITEIEGKSIVLDNRVLINFLKDPHTHLKEGQDLVIKGRCVGFDELLLQVKIDQADINENKRNQ